VVLVQLENQVEPTAHGKEEPASPESDNQIGVDRPPCPECGGAMRFVADVPRSGEWPRSKPSPFWCDTSWAPLWRSRPQSRFAPIPSRQSSEAIETTWALLKSQRW